MKTRSVSARSSLQRLFPLFALLLLASVASAHTQAGRIGFGFLFGIIKA